jgi:hypothetical protein
MKTNGHKLSEQRITIKVLVELDGNPTDLYIILYFSILLHQFNHLVHTHAQTLAHSLQ